MLWNGSLFFIVLSPYRHWHGLTDCKIISELSFFFIKFFGGHESFWWGHWYPYFGLLETSPLGFKARMDPSLACFVACMQWFPEIHLWCDTRWPLGGQRGSQSRFLHACSRGRMLGFDQTSRTLSRRAIHLATATGLSSVNFLLQGVETASTERVGQRLELYFRLYSGNVLPNMVFRVYWELLSSLYAVVCVGVDDSIL